METTTAVKAIMGASVSYAIGSDAYHHIIIATERSSRNIVTTHISNVLHFLNETLEQWNQRDFTSKIVAANRVHYLMTDNAINALGSKEEGVRWVKTHMTSTFTLRKDGSYRMKGNDHGYLHIGSDREYLDPSF